VSARDIARSVDRAAVRGFAPRVVDHGLWDARWAVHKFVEHRGRVYKAAHIQGLPLKYLLDNFELIEALKLPGNLLVNVGINQLWTIVAGTGGTLYDNSHAYTGVGDSATAATASDTGLNATTNKKFNAMDASYPTYGSSQYATWRSTFASGDANYTWNEICVANGNNPPTTGIMLNHKVQSMGTKASGTSWVASLQITLS
jgi:hypothetical protein